MDVPLGYQILSALFFLLLLSAFFSASETALTSLNRLKLKNLVEEGRKNAVKVEKLVTNQAKLLSTILIGNNIVNIVASSLATYFALHTFGDSSFYIGVATFVLTLLVLIFCEITPKTIATENAEKVAFLVATPMLFFVWLLTPVVFVVTIFTDALLKLVRREETPKPIITESELKTIVNVSHEEGVLEVDEREMIHNVFKFGDTSAYDICTPRTDMIAISLHSTYDEILNTFQEHGFSRLPVFGEDYDDIVGIIYLKDFFFKTARENFQIKDILREPLYTYEAKPTLELFNEMRLNRTTMAIVLDEHGGTSGLVTIEDFIEEIVGDLSDEYDEVEEDIKIIKENEVLVDGGTKIEEINKMLGTNLESKYYETIGGYVIEILGRVPEPLEEVERSSGGKKLKFIAEALDKNRIETLRIYYQNSEK